MLRIFLISFFFLSNAYGQEKLIKDLDHDRVNDTVYVDLNENTLVCKLSSQHFKKVESAPIDIQGLEYYIKATKSGFEFDIDWMRAGYSNQFRYDIKSKKIQLIL